MEESELRTSPKQRILIGLIAVLMLVTFVAVYALAILSSGSSSSGSEIDEAKADELYAVYTDAQSALDTEAVNWSDLYFAEFANYRSYISEYNSETVNSGGLVTEDLKIGDGAEITEDTDYYAYYVGWCANGAVFDSSFDDSDNPTALTAPLEASNLGLIDGWEEGVIGMKFGGVRLLSIPSDMAYADEEIEDCGGSNVPMKFIVMVLEPSEPLISLFDETDSAYNEWYIYQYTGMTYDEYINSLYSSEE